MKPVIRTNKCTGCRACRDVCPMDIFRTAKAGHAMTLKKNIGECIGCEECVIECPSDAIRLVRSK
jgi:NAD-dependent dihydropyrimidine dehydrogenase PreA subunit